MDGAEVISETSPETVGPTVADGRSARLTGIVLGLITVAFLLTTVGRSYDLDSGITVGGFVMQGSPLNAFTTHYLLNNHFFFSFLEHLVFSIGGSASEPVMRVLPILFGGATIGVLSAMLARRYGVTAAVTAAVVTITNPMFAVQSSEVRGYSLVTLCLVVTSAIVLRGIRDGELSDRARIAYGLLAAVGIATHLYMLVVVMVHGVVALSNRRVVSRMVVPWLAALMGLAAYVPSLRYLRQVVDLNGRQFRAAFPRDLAVELLGGSLIAFVPCVLLVAAGVWELRRERVMRFIAAGLAIAVVVPWIVAPYDLYPRFFLWMLPGVTIAIAIAVSKNNRFVVLAVVLVVAQVVTVSPRLWRDPFADRTAAAIGARVNASHGTMCMLDVASSLRMSGYPAPRATVPAPQLLPQCTVVVGLINISTSPMAPYADRAFSYRTRLPAAVNGVLWSRVPARCWTSSQPAGSAECSAANAR